MADNVQPDAGEEREASASGLLLSTDPLQDSTGYKLSADDTTDADNGDDTSDADNGDDDYDSDNGDSDNGDSDNGDSDSGDGDDSGPVVVEIGPGATDSADSDKSDRDDPDYSDN
ncbi:MAG TPA: hypothetical protein VFZ44_17780 [Pyrinomonadaceae bacterium]